MVSVVREDAGAIMERLFSDLSASLLTEDYARYRRWFAIPYDVFAFEGHVRVTSEAELKAMYDRVRAHYARNGVISFARMVHEANFPQDGRLRCLYETRTFVRRDTLFEDPFFCLTDLILENGAWKILRSEYDIYPSDAKHAVLINTGTAPHRKAPLT